MILCSNKYNLFSTISRHKDEVLKEDDTKTNVWPLEMNDKYLLLHIIINEFTNSHVTVVTWICRFILTLTLSLVSSQL